MWSAGWNAQKGRYGLVDEWRQRSEKRNGAEMGWLSAARRGIRMVMLEETTLHEAH